MPEKYLIRYRIYKDHINISMEFSEPFELESILSHENPLQRGMCSVSNNLLSGDMTRFLEYVDNLEESSDIAPHCSTFSSVSYTNSQNSKPAVRDSLPHSSNVKKSLLDFDAHKVNELEVTRDESYTTAKSHKKISCLTRSLQKENVYTDPNCDNREFTLFLFCTQNSISISVHKTYTVEQLITKALSAFTSSNFNTQFSLKYGLKPEAYEIWLVEDDGYLPETDFKVDRNMKISDLAVDSLALCEREDFSPSKESDTPLRKISQISKGIPLKICYESRWTIISVPPRTKLVNLFPLLQKKFVEVGYFNPSEYEFRMNLKIEDGFEGEECNLDSNLTVDSINTNRLKLSRKTFIDSPAVVADISALRVKKDAIDLDEGVVYDPTKFNLTKAQACAYKEYEVIKYNSRGKKQERVLGIDQLCLYNLTKTQAQQELRQRETRNRSILRSKIEGLLYSVTQEPEIPIAKLCNVRQIDNQRNCFEIEFKQEGEIKKKLYEASNYTIAAEIVAKIRKLIMLAASGKDSKKIIT